MTVKEKNIIRNFLFLTGLDTEETKRIDSIISKIEKVAEALPKEKRKECTDLEGEIMNLLDVVKWNYMDYGARLYEIMEEYELDWTPEKMKELEKSI